MPKFVPRQRKHKARAREAEAQNKPNAADGDAVAAEDSNALEILPASKRDREEKRERLREELRASQPKVSGKKKKRLEKYIVCRPVSCVAVEVELELTCGACRIRS